MALRIREFQSLPDVELFLRGGVSGGRVLTHNRGVVHGLHGLTLEINGGVVTFDETLGAAGYLNGLTLQEIRDQIVAVVATIVPYYADGRLHLVEATPAAGVTVAAAGTANQILGFNVAVPTVGVVVNNVGGGVPELVTITAKYAADGYGVVIEEA